MNVLKTNGYNKNKIEISFKIIKNHEQTPTRKSNIQRVFLSYVKDTIDKISRILKKYDITMVFQAHKK